MPEHSRKTISLEIYTSQHKDIDSTDGKIATESIKKR
jgi:hypothetical protein